MSWYFAARLSWRQLRYEKVKTATALLGVMFACVLVFMQLGFRDSLFQSASLLPRALNGDLFVVHKLTEAIWRGVSFSKGDFMRLYGHPSIEKINPFYISLAQFQNPETKQKLTSFILGYDPHHELMKGIPVHRTLSRLTVHDTLLFDEWSKPEFGPIATLLKKTPSLLVEVNDSQKHIVGTFQMGASFAASGAVVMSDTNFIRLFSHRSRDKVDVGIISLKENACPEQVKQELTSLLTPSLKVLTYKELVTQEEDYWKKRTAIGFIFGMGVLIGLVVGMVIVYQILFTDVMNHLREYATLRAIGYPQTFLYKIVISAALWLALLGFLPGVICTTALYRFTQSITLLPMPLKLKTIFVVWSLICGMCTLAGLFAISKLKSADPADLF